MSINTAALKRFAQATRIQLLSEVTNRLSQIQLTDGLEQREKADQISSLNEELSRIGKEALIDKVAYTWFNRLIAFRYMDANEYTESGIVSGPEGTPQILKDAQAGIIADDLQVDTTRIKDLLLGNIPSDNAQNEVYKLILVAECNRWHGTMPFIFQPIDDYTELLLPQDMLSRQSIRAAVNEGLSSEDCEDVEIIGWLYQFYISDLNEELISSKKAYKTEDLAPASQLFTPSWIVRYMVDNTLGQVWTEINPNTKVTDGLEYYIKPTYTDLLTTREKKSVEEIKFFEPCVGSGHILSYAFDVFYKIYEEQGYTSPIEIVKNIITKNLWGVDIDERAAQLAAFVLIMKGRQKHRRFLRLVESESIVPNITFYENFPYDENFKNATNIGSLINVELSDVPKVSDSDKSLFNQESEKLKFLYKLLGQKYDVVVTNPPYIKSSRMEGSLKQYVDANHPETKSDLFATFILRCLSFCDKDGLTGYMTPFVWMFISSYESIRKIIIEEHFINNLIQLEYSGFDGATVPICTFTLRNKNIPEGKGSYVRLSDFKGSGNQGPKTLEAIRNPNCGWLFYSNQEDFSVIPGSPIGYWAKRKTINLLSRKESLGKFGSIGKGLDTGDNNQFLRYWYEVSDNNDWIACQKGGTFRKWFGNNNYVIYWKNDGAKIKNFIKSNLRNSKNYFKSGITWTRVSSGKPAFRFFDAGQIFESTGPCAFFKNEDEEWILGFLNSKVTKHILKIYAPTLDFQSGHISKIPFLPPPDLSEIKNLVLDCIKCSRDDWNQRETSYDFSGNELRQYKFNKIEKCYTFFQNKWTNKFHEIHKIEEELNRQFIDLYGLNGELTPELQLKDITILKSEARVENRTLVFNPREVFVQFISYSVGCMFGRYSIDKDGLILGSQGEVMDDYYLKVVMSITDISFIPDKDGVIPILSDTWFEDDIVGQLSEFLKASFSSEYFAENFHFLESQLGKDVRKWFVRDFYEDHVKRFNTRPIYWMFSSPKGHFNVLIYMHRYTPDMVSTILHDYLKPYVAKLEAHQNHLDNQLMTSGLSTSEKNKLEKKKKTTREAILDCLDYERDTLLDIAQRRIEIDLDDGVLVNYNKFGKAVKTVAGLNDAKAKKKVRGFDWIDTSLILD